jgi:hypothetical protein
MPATETPPAATTDPTPLHRDQGPSRRIGFRRPSAWVLAIVVVVIAAGVAAALLLTGDSKPQRLELGKPRIVSSGELSSYAHLGNRTAFWAGPPATGYKLELTEIRGTRIFVRYLTADAKAGDPRAAYTTVATYPMTNAYARIRAAASRKGAVESNTSGGAVTLYYKKSPTNVYVARPGLNYLVEVFAPQSNAALQLAGSPSLTQVK